MTVRRSTPSQRSMAEFGGTIFNLILFACVIAYWLYARALVQVSGPSEFLANLWQTYLSFLPLPTWFVFLTEMFNWRVLLHLLPMIVGWWLARGASIDVMRVLYDLPDKKTAQQYLDNTRQPGRTKESALLVSSQTLADERDNYVRLRVGGPGWIQIGVSDVAVTEVNGRYYRIIPIGKHFLQSIEYIHTVLDLRPQERSSHDLLLITKDGIQIEANLRIAFRIDTGNNPPTKSYPYPYNQEAVRKIAYGQTVQPDGRTSSWDDLPIKVVQRELKKIVARYTLDEILNPSRPSEEPHLTIQSELTRQTRQSLANNGIQLTDLQIEKIAMPQDAMAQYIEYWQSHWESQIQISQADGDAYMLEEIEVARAEAEVTMIQAIMEGVQRAQQAGNARNVQEVIALRLIESLEKMARQSQAEHPISPQIMMELSSMRQELLPPKYTSE